MTQSRPSLLNQAATQIRKASRILLACHVRPDADALGSLLGLARGLQQLGKQTLAVSPDGVPTLYRFLPGWETVRSAAEGKFDLAIGLDADGSDRLGSAEGAILSAPTVIDVDHHTGPDPYGDIQVVDRSAAATGELVYELLLELGVRITPEIAQCLLAAIMTDTGSFRFSNVTANVFRVAGGLVEAGAHPAPLYNAIYGTRSYGAARLLGKLLDGLRCTRDGRIAWASLSREDFRNLGMETDATEGFVDQIRMVEGSEVAIFAREETNGEIRVSLRSGGEANVARVAERFGGGGHVPAAGCTLPGPLDAAVRRVLDAAAEEIGSR